MKKDYCSPGGKELLPEDAIRCSECEDKYDAAIKKLSELMIDGTIKSIRIGNYKGA